MELMDTSLDKFYKQVHEKGMTIPEDILGKTTVSVSAGHGNCVSIALATLRMHSFCRVSLLVLKHLRHALNVCRCRFFLFFFNMV